MGSPRVPLAPARRAFQLQTATAVCHQKTRRPSSRVPPSAWGARLPPFFFSCKKKGGAKVKCALRKSVSPVATGDRGALPPRLPCKPLKRLDRNFTGLRPCWLRPQAVAIALQRVKPPQGAVRARHRGHPGPNHRPLADSSSIPTWVLASEISPERTISTAWSKGTGTTSKNSPRSSRCSPAPESPWAS